MVVKSSPLPISLILCRGHLFANDHFSVFIHVRIDHHHHILTREKKPQTICDKTTCWSCARDFSKSGAISQVSTGRTYLYSDWTKDIIHFPERREDGGATHPLSPHCGVIYNRARKVKSLILRVLDCTQDWNQNNNLLEVNEYKVIPMP